MRLLPELWTRERFAYEGVHWRWDDEITVLPSGMLLRRTAPARLHARKNKERLCKPQMRSRHESLASGTTLCK